jgi:2-C-methyl-D-erythritol 4-phosphate cytidylyltransferase
MFIHKKNHSSNMYVIINMTNIQIKVQKMAKLILLNAGTGTRANQNTPKQFIEIFGKPLFIHTLEAFENLNYIEEIYIVTIDGFKQNVKLLCEEHKIKKIKSIISGGRTLLHSIKNGIEALMDVNDEEIILIHDAVRPFVSPMDIENCIHTAQKFGNAMSAITLHESLIVQENDAIPITSMKRISRDLKYRILTPQCFQYGEIKFLLSDESFVDFEGPCLFSYYMSKGKQVFLSSGSPWNIKFTFESDFLDFERIFKTMLKDKK